MLPFGGAALANDPTQQSSAVEPLGAVEARMPDSSPMNKDDTAAKATPASAAKKPATKSSPYKDPFYDNDFRYLDEPGSEKKEYFELLKRVSVIDGISVDVGGEFRHQFKSEDRRSLLIGTPTTPRTDNFDLWRLRLYQNVTISNWLRGYVEFIDAVSTHEDLPPLAIDENRSDVLNLFGDVLLCRSCSGRETWIRFGRQELLYDNERLISPLDWANTRRTFDGVKLFSRGEQLDLDLFYTRPVRVLPTSFDQPDQSRWFGGIYATYKGFQHQKLSTYFLTLREEDVISGPLAGAGHQIGSGNHDNRLYTTGSRLYGEYNDWLWDLEGALQLGDSNSQSITAGMLAAGLGRKLTCRPMEPTVWLWYDYASGDENPFDGHIGTFNQLFPLGHKYFGYLDLVGRQNVHDLNFQVFLKPTKKLTLLTWIHLLWLAEAEDALYNAAGVASRQDTAGTSGQEIGQEIDLVGTYALRPGVDFQLGYSIFFAGDFIRNSGDGDNANFAYTQLRIKF
jgi:hypothetical protein